MAIDCVLESGLDVRDNQRLQTFYVALVDRIYREEVPLRILMSKGGPKGVPGFRDQKFVVNRNDELSKPFEGKGTGALHPTSNSDNLAELRREYLSSTEEYKASLQRLLAVYESNLRQAEERFATAKQLYSNGLILQNQLDDAAGSVNSARDKVLATRKLISNADNQIATALLESKQRIKASSVGPIPSQLANGQVSLWFVT